MNHSTEQDIRRNINPLKIVWPILLGLTIVGILLYRDYNPDAIKNINFTNASVLWLSAAFLLMVIRHLGYMIRLKVLTENELSWMQCFRIILLWEFSSAITPSAIGGTGLAIIYISKEGISVGRSSAIAMATSFLDELYFGLFFPILILLLGKDALFFSETQTMSIGFTRSLVVFAIVGYCIKLGYVGLMGYALFYNPRGFKWLLMKVFRFKYLRKWRQGANKAGDEIITSSRNLKSKRFAFWLKAFLATFFSWTSRYWVLNAILVAFWFTRYDFWDHMVIFARQFVLWIAMMVSPTPGGSGFAEVIFKEYFEDFLPFVGVAAALALLWRLISYYPYLVGGAIYAPRWLQKHFKKSKPPTKNKLK